MRVRRRRPMPRLKCLPAGRPAAPAHWLQDRLRQRRLAALRFTPSGRSGDWPPRPSAPALKRRRAVRAKGRYLGVTVAEGSRWRTPCLAPCSQARSPPPCRKARLTPSPALPSALQEQFDRSGWFGRFMLHTFVLCNPQIVASLHMSDLVLAEAERLSRLAQLADRLPEDGK